MLECTCDRTDFSCPVHYGPVPYDQRGKSAVEARIDKRRNDPEFMARLEARVEQDESLLRKLAKEEMPKDEPWEDDINVGFEFLQWLLDPAEGELFGTKLEKIINFLDAGDHAFRLLGRTPGRAVQEDLERWLERLTS